VENEGLTKESTVTILIEGSTEVAGMVVYTECLFHLHRAVEQSRLSEQCSSTKSFSDPNCHNNVIYIYSTVLP
jgi:hypothetical protein